MIIKKMGIIPNLRKEGIRDIISDSIEMIPDDVELLGEKEISGITERIRQTDSFRGADLILALGGDGTILYAARVVENEQIPIMGIKIRSLGFLAEDNHRQALRELFAGGCSIQERMRLASVHKGGGENGNTALNDIVINGVGVSRVLHVRMKINDTLLGEYLSDGVILSTPTGSTAYSLAAGGPIIDPVRNDSIIITPLCPHSLSVRPVVVSSEETIEIEVLEAGGKIIMTRDGQDGEEIELKEKVKVRKSAKVTRLVVRDNYNFYTLVREKLGWGGVLRRR
ncbi:MAG: NAD(+)/NADH kinase [Candidatus Krumholzibacteriales bacterium]